MKIAELLLQSAEKLREKSISSSRFEAELLLSHVLDQNRVWLYTHNNEELSENIVNQYHSLLDRRLRNEPMAYILGMKEFMGLDFYVDNSVLIPRPDTECVVETVLDQLNNDKTKVLDLCTGSGAIGLSIKYFKPEVEVVLSDISAHALIMAQKNASNLKLDVKFVLSDLFDDIHESFDIIVSNPPYIPTEVIDSLEKDVKDYEPLLALDGGVSGFDFYEKIILSASKYLKPGGYLILESGHDQGEELLEMMSSAHFDPMIRQKDLSGFLRCVGGIKK